MSTSSGSQSRWQRVTLLTVLWYEGIGALLGGSMLVASPDGRLMDMPVSIMHGTFQNFLIPGIILFAMGVLTCIAAITVLRRSAVDWVMALVALGGMVIWFWIEIAILQQVHWLHAMWGLPVVLGLLVALPLIPDRTDRLHKAALSAGIVASILYIAINIIVPNQWPSYDAASQTVSELSAVDAPTRALWVVLCTPYSVLMIAFAWAVYRTTNIGDRRTIYHNNSLHTAGGLLLAYAALGIFWPFAPMHLRETLAAGGATISDTMHIALGVVTEILFLLALGFAATAFGRAFRIYSTLTFFVVLIFGAFTFWDAPAISRNQPTPLIGIWERVNIGVFMAWVIVLAVSALRLPAASSATESTVQLAKTVRRSWPSAGDPIGLGGSHR